MERYLWELAEKRKDGTTVCVHGRTVEYDDKVSATAHTDDHSKCTGTGTK